MVSIQKMPVFLNSHATGTGLVTSALIQLVSRQASKPPFLSIRHNPKNSVYELKIQSAYVDFLWHGRPGHDQSRASRPRCGMKTGFSP
jgi:hypothetical protein